MNTLIIVMLFALASPIFCEDQALEPKKQEKRGLAGLGYGSYLGAHGYGYNGLGHGYVGTPYYSSLGHGVATPVLSHSYSAPLAYSHGYSGYHGYNSPHYSAPLRVGYGGLGHGLGHYNYW
ncbi:glycine-rich protein-like [Chelonus insularis]|uniref:glycine-rich protein-like n=1 Tax=Chelonus insularis TaxID=460826 RepID=UPI00158D7AA3|nr:glycine-rich protein-like [Chelonus insularis]